MVLHKFALPGGKVPAATGMRAAGRPPKTLPPPGAAVFGLFLSEGVRFLRLMFFRRFRTFCGRDRTDSPSPARASQWVVFIHLAVCRFWAFAVGKNGSHPRKANQWIDFIHPCRLSILGFCSGEEWFPSPQGKAIGSILSTLAACRFWAFAMGRNSSHPRKGKANGWVFYPLSPGFANCGAKSSPSRRRASSRAGCGGRAVK